MTTRFASTHASPLPGIGRPLLALVLIGLGVVGFITYDVASVWQRIPFDSLRGNIVIAYAFAAIELATGIGLLIGSTFAIASGVLFAFLLLWLLLKVPAIVAMPAMEATWLGFGEIGVIVAGGWILFALADTRGRSSMLRGRGCVRMARVLFALSLPMIGLSHFCYPDETVKFIPAYIPFPYVWAYVTGAGSLLTCLAVLTGVWVRLATMLEAAMLMIITVLVWLPGLSPMPVNIGEVTGFLISAAIAAGAWTVADSYRDGAWLARQSP